MNRYVNNAFENQSFRTIGVEFLNKDVEVNGEAVTLQIWDTAGQERYKSLRTPFYRGADCCMLCFDVTAPVSFENLTMWKREFIEHADISDSDADKFPFVVVATKVDEPVRKVSASEARGWCAENSDLPYFETSAKQNSGVDKAFIAAGSRIMSLAPKIKQEYDTLDLEKEPETPCAACVLL